MLERVSWDTMFCQYNDGGSKSLSRHPEEGIAKENRNMLNCLLERVSLVGILCSGNSMTEEIEKLVETP